MKNLIKIQFLVVLIISGVVFADYSDSIREARRFREHPESFVKNCSIELLKKNNSDTLGASLTKEDISNKLDAISQNPDSTIRWVPKVADPILVNKDSIYASGMLSVETYLSGKNVWEGIVFLDGPVYVYDEVNNPSFLEIKEGTMVIPMSSDAGIYTMEGSSFKARRVYFGPIPTGGTSWEGIYITGKPREFLFDENEVRSSRVGINLENTQYIKITDSIFKWAGWGVAAYPGANVYLLNDVVDDAYYNGVTMIFETVTGEAKCCDLNQDNAINLEDFNLLAVNWMGSLDPNDGFDPNDPGYWEPNSLADIDGDLHIDVNDLQVFCTYWLCDPNTSSDAIPGSGISLENCTITGSFWEGYAHDFGIFVKGTEQPENAGIVSIRGCLITSSYQCAIYQTDWQAGLWQDNAFFHNPYVTNYGNPFLDLDSIFLEEDEDPFEFYFYNGYESWDMLYFLWSESELIDRGPEHIFESNLLGKTTCWNLVPDMGLEDIGYHYPDLNYCDEGFNLESDINGDNFVNLLDFNVLANDWGWSLDPNSWPTRDPNDPLYHEPNVLADIDGDGIIYVNDLMIMSNEWLLECTGVGSNGSIQVFLNEALLQPTSVVSGLLDFNFDFLNVAGSVSSIRIERDDEEVLTLDFDDAGYLAQHYYEKSWRRGNHATYVFRALLDDGNFITSRRYSITFNNEISIGSELKYCLNENLALSILLRDAKFYTLGIFNGQNDDPNSVALYSQELSSSGDIVIPKEVFANDFQIYRIKIFETTPIDSVDLLVSVKPSGVLVASPEPGLTLNDLLTMDLNKASAMYWGNTRAVISIGNSDLVGSKVSSIMLEQTYNDLHPKGMNVVYIGPEMIDENFREIGDYANLMTVSHWLAKATLWYHFSHGNDHLWAERARQVCHFGNKKVFSHTVSSYSNPSDCPSGLERLIRYESCWTLRDFNLYDHPKGAVIFDGCKHGATDENPRQLGIFSTNQPEGGSIFIGWRVSIPMYDSQTSTVNHGEYGKYRELLAYGWTRKMTFGSARDLECRDLLWGHEMRDNLYIIGAGADNSYWATPNISSPLDSK